MTQSVLLDPRRRKAFRELSQLLPDPFRNHYLQIQDPALSEQHWQELGLALRQAIRSGAVSRRDFLRAIGAIGAAGLVGVIPPRDAHAWQSWVGFWQNPQTNPAATYTGPDPYWDYVSLLMQFDGANGASVFADESHAGKNPTLAGSPSIDTSAGSSPYSGRTGCILHPNIRLHPWGGASLSSITPGR